MPQLLECFELSRCLSSWHKRQACASVYLNAYKGKKKKAETEYILLAFHSVSGVQGQSELSGKAPWSWTYPCGWRLTLAPGVDPAHQWVFHVATCLMLCVCGFLQQHISKCLVQRELPGIHPRLRVWARHWATALCFKKTLQYVHGKTQILRCNYGTYFSQMGTDHVVVKGLPRLAAGEITEDKGENRGFSDWKRLTELAPSYRPHPYCGNFVAVVQYY